MIKPITMLSAALLLTSCAAWFPPTTTNSDIDPTDGSKTINTVPQFIECVRMPPCAYVAYYWNSKRPDDSELKFMIDDLQTAANGYRTLDSITLNIDDDTFILQPNPDNSHSADDIYVKTYRSYSVPLTLLNNIEQSANTTIKIITDVGTIDADFKESRAFLGLVNFNKQVSRNRS